MSRAWAASVLAMLLAGCQPPPEATPLRRPATVADLAARLPAEAAGFQRGATTPLPRGEDGREIGYRTPGRIAAGATVQLYRLPGVVLPEGLSSPDAADAFNDLLQDAMRPAPQRRLREEARFTLPAEGPALLRCAETAGSYGRERVQGLLCAGSLGGGLLRLRVTMPRQEPLPADSRAFATGILAALRTP
ncbi:hypothetical protein [Belnapia rosea]|uniref:Lipoprotein n=1 Tax=Belnapia rosea TaxID=938405 RepID=A0A1G6YM89_9PROT|nr:hypothetical protein [Belnapia rosea]SDD91421.1 hypothetical protein SAMN04487779_1014109 [Belnapia rosea]